LNDLELAERIRRGERVALARAITLVESSRAEDRARAAVLLDALLPERDDTTRVAISGPPGAGKSTLIEALGQEVMARGQRIAVLAIDPTSSISGGSILGDKHRMTELAANEQAFVRPSPAGSTLGGIARRTREAMILCEAAGFDVVIIETVGVGQSEVTVKDMVDCFTLVLAPGGGDEIQGMKKGIVEIADLVVVNKADGSLEADATRLAHEYMAAMHIGRHEGERERNVLLTSATERRGVDALWDAIDAVEADLAPVRAELRSEQRVRWFQRSLIADLTERITAAIEGSAGFGQRAERVRQGVESPAAAAAAIADQFTPTIEPPRSPDLSR